LTSLNNYDDVTASPMALQLFI